MKYPLTNIKTESAAVCYGIGHAGLECFIRGAQTFKIIGYRQKLNSFGLSSFTEGKSPEQAEAIVGQLSRFAEKSLIVSIFDIISIATDFGVHIALSLLIFSKIQEQKPLKWLGLAILLHYALNAVSAVTSMSGSLLFTKTAVIIVGCGIITLICKLTGVNRYGLFK
ncbi:MAG: YhfC family intramembrane metalloprotease [Ruminococcus sp.]|nr:YhfC family intramembrane metalloprotease [Ruminococcus sp.]